MNEDERIAKPKTNGDRLRAMSNEELAGNLNCCPKEFDQTFVCDHSNKGCKECLTVWLNSPAESARLRDCEIAKSQDREESDANAALIAAAPEMYEFIEWLRSVEGQCAILKAKRYLPQILDKLDEILKKARG